MDRWSGTVMKPDDEQRNNTTLPERAERSGNPNIRQEEHSGSRTGVALARGSREVFLKGVTVELILQEMRLRGG